MEYFAKENNVIVSGVEDFVPRRIFECGQCFRWDEAPDGSWLGVAGGKATRVVALENGSFSISGSIDDFENHWRNYFDLDLDYGAVRNAVAIDDYMKAACDFGAGIRILNQDGWEALCSFIISQCNNIPRIKGIINVLCENWGEEIWFEGQSFYAFPDASVIAPLEEKDLAPLRCGYRSEYIINAARAVDSGTLDLQQLKACSGAEALAELKTLRGVGDKVANCVLLFGLHKLDSFPVDVWIRRTLNEKYGRGFDPAASFGAYAGIAQQYMFYYARSGESEV